MEFVQLPDTNLATRHTPIYHFDNDEIKETNERLISETDTLINDIQRSEMTEENLKEFRKTIGELLHTIQDFYSHSNWIEAGFDGIAENIGFTEEFKVPLNEGKNPECKPCERVFTKEENEYFHPLSLDSFVAKLLGVFTDFEEKNVYSCQDNILEKKSLFTGRI